MHISGKQVAAARELLGITQVELAEATGLSFITIHNFEANKSEPYRATREKIVAELERRGIEFTNGTGIGVRLNFEKAAEYSRTTAQTRPASDR